MANNTQPVSCFRRRLFCQSGQALIELALTIPMLMFILAGAAEFARFGWASVEVANAARAGAQYGAQTHITASDTTGIQTAALNDGANLSGLTASSTHTCACSTAASTAIACSTALTSCAAPNTVLEFVQVTTSASITPVFHWAGLPTTFTASGSAIMEVQQ